MLISDALLETSAGRAVNFSLSNSETEFQDGLSSRAEILRWIPCIRDPNRFSVHEKEVVVWECFYINLNDMDKCCKVSGELGCY